MFSKIISFRCVSIKGILKAGVEWEYMATSRGHLKKMKLIKKFLTVYDVRKFITMLTRAHLSALF
jgi:hypothetical protein